MNKTFNNNSNINSYWLESYKGEPHKIFPAQDFANLVYDNINFYEEETKYWREKVKRSKEEVREEVREEFKKENDYLRNCLTYSYGCFDYKQEKERFESFVQKHVSCRLSNKFNGGKMPYVMSYGTGFNTCFTVVCPICNEQEDITYIG